LTGPSREAREKGFFEVKLVGEAEDGRKAIATVKGVQDPGYGETSKMLSESGLALVLNRKELPRQGTNALIFTMQVRRITIIL